MRAITDQEGRRWVAERIGRTSGIVRPDSSAGSGFPEPTDIIRFSCESRRDEAERETTLRAGLLEELSDSELLTLLQSARKLRRPNNLPKR
jgi:hypothetical protein